MMLSTDAKGASNTNTLVTKTVNNLEIEGSHFSLVRAIYEKPK